MKAILTIRSEHRTLGVMLYTLEQLMDEAKQGKAPDFRIFHAMMTYIDRFLNTFHHPKEDTYLLPILRVRYPEATPLLDEIIAEHEEGERLFVRMLKALSAYECSADLEYSGFESAVQDYHKFERLHAEKEEKKILPLAEEKLNEEDWKAIDAAFSDNNDPLFGKNPTKVFRELYTSIVNTIPEPYGLGEQWK